jgi:DNA adenine methylase
MGIAEFLFYAAELYDKKLKGWERIELPSYADGARPRIEVVWLNPACSAALNKERAGAGMPLFPFVEAAE